jgi:hypothetical protein
VELERFACGHCYDPAKHTTCPYCGVPGLDVPPTTPLRRADGLAVKTMTSLDEGTTRPINQPPADGSDPVTKPLVLEQLGIDPVVGWLVCVEGPDRGRDYRIRSENNTIGRSNQVHICIAGDDSISRDKYAAAIAFEPHRAIFYLIPGEARGLAYLNGEVAFSATQLKAYDKITIGRTVLLFIPLCGENFRWKTDGE